MAELTFDAVSTAVVQPTSCNNCKTRKLKCTRRIPCSSCERKGSKCTYSMKVKDGTRRHRPIDKSDKASSQHLPTTMLASQEDHRSYVPPGAEAQHPVTTSIGIPPTLAEDALHLEWDLATEEASPYGWPGISPNSYPLCPLSDHFLTAPSDESMAGRGNSEYQSDPLWLDTPFWLGMADLRSPSLHGVSIIPVQSNDFGTRPDTNNSIWPSRIPHSHLLKILDLYLRQIHPSIPFFKTADVVDGINECRYRNDRHFGAMILALCTFTLLQPQEPNLSLLSGDILTSSDFLEETLALRRREDMDENPTLDTLLTDIYLFTIFELLGQKNAAWLSLQQAITVSEILELARSDILYVSDSKEWEKRNRLYLCLIVSERAYVFGRWRRISVPAVPRRVLQRFSQLSLREDFRNDVPESRNISALYLMAETFDGLDSDLLQCWNGNCEIQQDRRCDRISLERILGLLRRVPGPRHRDWLHIARSREEQSSEDQDRAGCSGCVYRNDQGDVLLTCLWVLSRLWRLAFQHGHVSHGRPELELRPSFPINIARMCLSIIKSFTISGLEVHGEGLAAKMFDVASEFIMAAYPQRAGDDILRTDFARRLEPVQLQDEYELFAGSSDQPRNDTLCLTIRQNSSAVALASEVPNLSNIDIANGFLGFFALFRNGKHECLQPYLECYKRVAGSNSQA